MQMNSRSVKAMGEFTHTLLFTYLLYTPLEPDHIFTRSAANAGRHSCDKQFPEPFGFLFVFNASIHCTL